ncbi:E3 ubiquitin-protein ligase HEL2 [Pseudozyma hubeiensis]|nr:E3 ubiquitin-protein ligase HEL2 [Pseudozyma hubeiensis]
MSATQESKPPPSSSSSRGSRGGSSSNRRGGGSSRGGASGGGGRRANFGGSLTPSDSNRAAASTSRGRSNNHSRSARPQKDRTQPQQAAAEHEAEPLAATTAVQIATQDVAAHDDGDDELPPEAELCFICADPVKLTSIAPCDHRTCHICALRLRVLYKKDECTFCKATIDHLIFTSHPTKSFADFQPSDIPYTDKKLPISFETKEALEETVLLLRFNCPDPNCEIACTGWKDLRAHVRREHARMVCQLCISNKKIFAHEHTLHTEQSLAAHEKAEHRLCEYDRQWFYSDDELFAHMRDRHEQCFICKASGNEDERWKYYRDYDMLERHFRKDHWLCENKECLEEKFRVFKDEVDYKAHQLERHANELSSRERRDALRIEAGFTYDDPSAGSSRSGSGGGGGKKGKGRANGAAEAREENRDVLGVSALASRAHVPGAGPANHQSRRAMFGSGLTNPNPAPPQGVSADRPRTITDTRSTEQRHQAYMDKVTSLLQTDSSITSFRHAVRLFKNNESSARDLISTFHSLVGDQSEECATLVNGMIDLLDGEKREEMGRAWNEWRLERTQFPSLTGVGREGGTLKSIKKSSSANTAVWENVERAASSSSGAGKRPVVLKQHFPSLGSGGSSGTPSIPGSLAHAVAHGSRASAGGAKWSAAPVVATSSGVKPFVARVHSTGGGGRGLASGGGAFPSLPSNKERLALNAHKKTLFGSGSNTPNASAGGSGSNTPWLTSGTGGSRIDDFPEITGGAGGGVTNMDALNEALTASQGGAAKGRKKGVQMMSFGGVHRG